MLLTEAAIDERALRLGITVAEIRHCLAHFIAYGSTDDVTMLLGPQDEHGHLLEVAIVNTPDGPLIIHAGIPTRMIGVGGTQ